MAGMIYENISSNRWKSIMLVFFFFLFMMIFGVIIGFIIDSFVLGAILILVVTVILVPIQYYTGDKLILAITHVRPATKKEFPQLIRAVDNMVLASGLPRPQIYVTEDTAPNAFVTGRNPEHASLVATTGLMQKLNFQELEGVIAHEFSHIGERDIRLMMMASVMVGIVALLADIVLRSVMHGRGNNKGSPILVVIALLFIGLSPIIATLIKLAISRKREFLADANGALLTRYPEGLASALEKLEKDKEPLEVANKATAHLYIVNPLKNYTGFFDGMFSTHPPIEERVRRLRAM